MIRSRLATLFGHRLPAGRPLVVCLSLLVVFGLLARGVMSGQLTALDTRLGLSLQQHRLASPELRSTFLIVTQLGSSLALAVLTGLVAVSLLVRRRRRLAMGWLLALVVTGLLNFALKEYFARERPGFRDPAIAESNESFPSGHSMGSLIAYGLLAYLLLPALRRRWARRAAVAAAGAMIVAIGFSRMYLGAHYFSDVLGGYAVGGAWLALCASWVAVARRGEEGPPNSPLP